MCGATWGNGGVAYPTVDLSGLPDAARYEDPFPVEWGVFEARRAAVLPLLPPGAFAPPGTALGPLHGRISGRFADFVWPYSWTLLVRREALFRLRAAGLEGLRGATPHLRGPTRMPPLEELQIEPRGVLALASDEKHSPCSLCGRLGLQRPSQIVLDRSSLPTDQAVFRLRDLTTAIFATEPVVEAYGTLGLTGAVFSEVPAE
jgi:uncharacterized double-CXXCG motif protein